MHYEGKGKGFPYSLPNVGPGADHDVQKVIPQVTISHPPGNRLPLLSARHAVTFPTAEHNCPLASTKLYCLVTEAHKLTTCWSQVQRSTHSTTAPPTHSEEKQNKTSFS